METVTAANHDDPQFVKVLETCLKMEIAVAREKFEANRTEIQRLRATIRTELNNRKQLKARVAQMHRVKIILNETLTKLYASISETSDALEAMRANIDDQYKLIQLRSQEYEGILAKYKETWHSYRAVYEEFPLAKARHAAKINLEKLKIEHMVMTYKRAEIMTIIRQRRRIDWIRTRGKIIEFATVMVEHSKLETKSKKLQTNVDYQRKELRSIETELQILRKQEEDQERVRKQKLLEMAPPKINIPFRKIYSQNRMHTRVQSEQFHETFDDNISVNTLVLEELCVNENASMLADNMDVESLQNDGAAVETIASNLRDTVISEKTDTCVASIAPDDEMNAEKAVLADNDVEMKETHLEETQKSQESVKACVRTKENSLKHGATKDTQEEIKAKRIRLQREDSAEDNGKMSVAQSSVEKMDLTSSSFPPVPKITKVETVHYNVASIKSLQPRYVQHSNATPIRATSPLHYEYCESNMSSIDQDFTSKGPQSLFDGSLSDYRLWPNSNISPMGMAEDAQISPPKYALQQQDINQSDGNASTFQFDDFMKKREKTENEFILF